MANYPVYPYGGYQTPYYPQQMQGQMNTMQQPQQIQSQIVPSPSMVQTVQTPPMNQTLIGSQGNSMIWVPNFAAANEYLVAANNAVALWDQNSPYVYLKQADSTGKPTIKVYELVERDQNQRGNLQPQVQLPDFGQFVKRDDLRGFVTRDDLDEIISERLKKPLKASGKKEED